MTTILDITLLTGIAVVLTATLPVVVKAGDGFKSQFQRRTLDDLGVSETPLEGDIDADFRPGGESRPTTLKSSGKKPSSSKAKPAKEPQTKAEKLAVLDARIKQQEENIRRMKKELADAKREKRNPDPKKLKQYATATGDRSAAYDAESKYVKDLIDRFEEEAPNGAHATLLATATLFGRLWQTHYKIEIDRSQRFIKILQEEKRKLQ